MIEGIHLQHCVPDSDSDDDMVEARQATSQSIKVYNNGKIWECNPCSPNFDSIVAAFPAQYGALVSTFVG